MVLVLLMIPIAYCLGGYLGYKWGCQETVNKLKGGEK